ncbi:MAG: DNA polymerase III subunit alpha [Bacilli bacterium]|nr:DNA polymerase III subunit alpha [Bacilli bacterium]
MYVPLNVKTDNSLLHSIIKVSDLITYAKEKGIKTLAIADNMMYGVMDFYHQCLNNNIKPIIGLEINTKDFKLNLYAQNDTGYHNLIKLSTLKTEKEIELSDLDRYKTELVCILPYKFQNYYEELSKYYKYIYVSYRNEEEKKTITYPSIYMNEVLYLHANESEYIKYLDGIKTGKTIDMIENNYINQSLDEDIIMSGKLQNQTNLMTINSLCDLKINFAKNLLPIYECPDDLDAFTYLKKLCMQGLKSKFGNVVGKRYVERLKYELSTIKEMGFCNYFLIVYDYVKYAKEKDILVGPGRGSAAGSLVSYCLNITTIDPLKYNLLFERFLNPERITMPDIDIDFEYNRREEVINYCINKYGFKKVAPIITFGTLGAKQAIRDVGRVMDIELTTVDTVCKMLNSTLSLRQNYQDNIKLQKYINSSEQNVKLYKTATKLENIKRHTSTHAAGIVMSYIKLDDIIPLEKQDNYYLTGYSMEYLEEIGLLKMDFLALKNLTLINNVINDINSHLKSNLSFDEIPLEDSEALNIFSTVNTLGIFQFESAGMMNFSRKFRPNTFEDLFAAVALFRPGPMNNIDSYIKRKQGYEKIDYFDASLEPILKPTYGIIIYQEQIMQIANVMANYSFGEADLLRRAMSKKKENILLQEEDKFINRSINNGYSKALASEVYQLILKFASYGFNRAHSVSYAMIAYKMAYLKAHYPVFFMKHLLSMVIGSEVKTKEYVYESRNNNITVLKPDINLSGADYKIENGKLRFPLSNIKNLGNAAVKTIIEERAKKPYQDIYDFISRTYGKAINRKTIESLIDTGCFDNFNINRNTLYTNLDTIINYAELIKDVGIEYALKPDLKEERMLTDRELMTIEKKVFGFYLSNHPITEYRRKEKNNYELSNIDTYFDQTIDIICLVEKKKEIATKKGQKMLFLTVSDENSMTDVILFSDIYSKYPDIIVGSIVKIKGKVEKRFDKMQIIASTINTL